MIEETTINFIAEGTRIEGKIILDRISRVYGTLVGEVHAEPGSSVVLGESSVVEGNIYADTLIVDGYVKGDIYAKTRVIISGTGRVIGNVSAPSLGVEFGAFFEGSCIAKQ